MHLLMNTAKLFLLLVQGPGLALSFQASTRIAHLCSQVVGLQCIQGGHQTEPFVPLDEPCKYIVRTAVVLNFY